MKAQWSVGSLRDYWPRPSAAAVDNLDWLLNAHCFRPKLVGFPLQGSIDVPANGYLVQTFAMIPGSWIVALSNVNGSALDFNMTDIGANYKFFSSPTPVAVCANSGGFFSPWYFPEPYMMAGVASLRVELWNNTTLATNNSQLVIHVMEPTQV